MKLIKITDQIRRDFSGIFECENCGEKETKTSCYDDRNYHDNVIPKMTCKNCGKSRNDLGIKVEITQTKYPEGFQV